MDGRKLSREEDLELEKHEFKLMNKPAVKTIKTIHGDLYRCVDFYQQPAFDHPLLKNHTFNFKISPSSYPKKKSDEFDDGSTIFDPSKIWLNGQGCPVVDPSKKYYGAGMFTTTHKVQVQHPQSSYSRMKVKNNADYIEVGWMVNPLMCNDDKTRMYIYTNAGSSRCFNTFCPGFVHVARDIPLDFVFRTQGPRTRVSIKFIIDWDGKLRNWRLYMGDRNAVVGFWDNRIFTSGLNNFATYIDWGGQVYGPPNLPSAPMRTGVEVSGDESTDAFCWQIAYANETSYTAADNVEGFSDIAAYKALDVGIKGRVRGHQFFYGGPGGYTGN
ncbi:unnamed protein product [Dovyalis caffra]|uniref:Neprosin PEP catalytic domain-containing protein n=1 Tax=Dovyalis caffra TaxID=77055 RepID=A0AAV1R770_9ROSI|nr:unnamed protein product [Dovyalis caffra]